MDQVTGSELELGFEATVVIASEGETWECPHFPILQLAIQLVRSGIGVPLVFLSSSTEEPCLAFLPSQASGVTVETFDGRTLQTTELALRDAFGEFVVMVDAALRDKVGWSIDDPIRDIETPSRFRRMWRAIRPRHVDALDLPTLPDR